MELCVNEEWKEEVEMEKDVEKVKREEEGEEASVKKRKL